MKYNEATTIIKKQADAIVRDLKKTKRNKRKGGFMVHWEVVGGGVLRSDYFPDKHAGERLIETEKMAWALAKRFADATDENYVNIYVVNSTFSPVSGYSDKKLKRY